MFEKNSDFLSEKSAFKRALPLVLCLFFFSSYAKNDPKSDIEQKIQAKGLKKSSLALLVSKIQTDNKAIPLYRLNGDKLFIPASLVKIATLSALYDYYPPSYTFKTSFVSSAPINKGTLKGDLILKGGGDSSFTSESLWKLVNILTRSGVKNIQGNLLIDDSLYKKEPPLPYSERSYLAPASASSFNWNSAAFYIRPGKTLKSPALVFANPENSYIEVINRVKTGKKNRIQIKRKSSLPNKELFEIKGEIDINKKEIVKYRNITRPALWLGYNSLSFLKQRGIKVSGRVKKGSCSGSCKTLAEWKSKPFVFHSYNLMKYSSNFVARMLVSHLPLLKGAKKGDLKEGMKWIKSHLEQKEKIINFVIKEPSGLDRSNRFSANDLQKILVHSKDHFYSPEMLSAYPLAGGQGTLEKRFPTHPLVRAKTGSLSGVSALAGWVETSSKESYAFVFIFNGKAKKNRKAQKLFDEIILSLLKYTGP